MSIKKCENMTKERAYELFLFICDEEFKGYKLACHSLRDSIAFTAGIIDKNGKVMPEYLSKENIIEKPKPPLNRLLYEFDEGKDVCLKCKSSFKRYLRFIKSIYCINSECENYYKLPII
jgi:hypothetical protein